MDIEVWPTGNVR